MTPNPPAAESVWQRLSTLQLLWVILFVLLIIIALFGGMRTADRVTPVSIGQVYNDGPQRITVRSVSVSPRVDWISSLSPQCRLLLVVATIQNTADRSVTFPRMEPLTGRASDCESRGERATVSALEISGIAAAFVGAVRAQDSAPAHFTAPGFTADFELAWAVPADELARDPRIDIRMPALKDDVSTFRIAKEWGAEPDRYGQLTVTALENR